MPQPRVTVKLVSLTALAAAMLAPVPAAAKEHGRDAERDRALSEMQGRLGNPETQRAMGDALAGMMAAMLDMKASPFLKAMDRVGKSTGEAPHHREIPDNATLGDLAGLEARRMPEDVARKAPAMMGAAGAMVGAMGEILPQLEEAGKRMGEQMRKTMDQAADRADEHRHTAE